MIKFIYHSIFLLAFSLVAKAQTVVQNLLVEQKSHPMGIATSTPVFSWQLQSEQRNIKQKGYEILVASSKALLENNVGDIWSSGIIDIDKTQNIAFNGKPLQPNQYYYVKVKVITNKEEVVWCKPVFFTVGLTRASDWKGKWIGYDKAFLWDSISQWSRLSARYFRKEFSSSKKIKKAFVHIVGLGLYELYLNGTKIGDQVLAPAPTDYRKSVLSNSFDVTEQIINGQNTIGVTLGNGRFFTMRQNYKPQKINNFGFPKMMFQLDLIYEDGSKVVVVSDQSWKFTADGPIRSNNEYDGEEYDATRELGNWSRSGYNDRKWLKASVVKAPAEIISPQPNLPMKVMQKLKPISLKKIKADTYILDMGQNIAGWLQISVQGKRGQKVKMRFAESLQADGSLYLDNLRDARVTDIYTLKGEGMENWHPRFVYHGFRYVELTGWPGTPDINDFEGHLVYDKMQTTGTMITSNKTINQILKNAWWGIASNYKGMPVDCPQRNERQPWLGDRAQGAYGESFLFDNASLYAKWLNDIEESQTAEGSIPDVAPAYWNYYSDNITWPGTYILVADMLCQQFGDVKSIQRHYPSMKKWMAYMRKKYMKDFLLTKDKYGDWCVPPESLDMIRSRDSMRNTKGELLATAYYYHLLGMMKKFALLSGNQKDTADYHLLAENIRSAFNKKFFNPQTNVYDNGTVTANLLPLYFGMTDTDKRQFVFGNIIKKLKADKMHISTGVIGTQWLMRTLTNFGRADVAYQLASNTTYPSWGYMIENGATTIWELWNGNTASPKMNSQNHIMLLGDLLIWLYEDLAGIKAQSPGFKEIVMKPAFQCGLNKVEASYQSVHGNIKSSWNIVDGKLKWHINIPANTSAIVYLPTDKENNISESDKPLKNAEGLELINTVKNQNHSKIGKWSILF